MRNLICLALLSALPTFATLGTPVPLTVTDRSGFARVNEGITTGVPVPQSANITDVRTLMVTTAPGGSCTGGSTIDSMLHVVARWGGAPTDASKPIKWVWVEFLGSVGASTTNVYCLADRSGADPGAANIVITQDGTYITVNTGAMTFKVRKNYFNFLESVQVGATTLVGGSTGSKWAVTAGGIEYNTVNSDGSYSATVEYPAVNQDASSSGGAIRAQIKLTGRFTSSDGTQKMNYQFRLLTYANSTALTLYPTITFSEDCFSFKPASIVLSLVTQLGSTLTYAFGATSGANTGAYAPSDDLLLTQFDHGDGANGYQITKNGTVLATGTQAPGWLDMNDGTSGVTAWVRDFWQNYPMALEANGKTLSIQMWPSYDFTSQFDTKRDNAMKGLPGWGIIWPSAEGSAMDFTPQAPNSNRLITTVTNANPPVVGIQAFNTRDTGGSGFCTTSLDSTGCNYWPVGSSRRTWIQGFTDANWSQVNGFHNVRNLGSTDAKGAPQFAVDGFDSTIWGTPHWGNGGANTGLCTFAGQSSLCPQSGSMDAMTDMNAVGVAKTWWVKLNFYAGGVVPGASTATKFADQLMLSNPSWYAGSEAFGRIRAVDATNFPKVENTIIPTAWNAMLAKDSRNHNYGTFNWGDTEYTQTYAYSGQGARTWAFSRKNWEFVPWLLYARSGDRKYMDWGISTALHGMDVDQPHTTTAFTDALGNVVNKKAGSGPCTHGPSHWYPVYENYTGAGSYSCSEGEQPTLDYQTESDASIYYLLAYDRGKEMLLERANFVVATEASAGNVLDHVGARNMAGCLQIGLDAYKISGSATYLGFAEKCFRGAVKHNDGTSSLGNPVGFVQGDRFGNSIDWSYFTSSWLNLVFAEMAEVDPDYCTVDVNNVNHCVRTEFIRFARALGAMGSNNGTSGVYYYGYPSKTWAYAYQYTNDATFLKFGKMLFTMYTSSPEGNGINGGVSAVLGPNPDVHNWSMYLQGLPYALYALVGQNPTPPDTPAFPLKIPSDGTIQTLLVNKPTDQAWTFTLSIDTGTDFGGGFFSLAGRVNVDVYDPTGALIQHNALDACAYQGPALCIPNSFYPVQSGTATAGQGKSVSYGGVDNRLLTFSVPADGKTGEYQIKLSAVNHAQNVGGCIGLGNDRFTCYTTAHFGFLMGTSLGNMVMVSPTVVNTQDCVAGSPYARIGRALLYFKVPSGASQVQASMSRLNFFLLDPSGNVYKYGSTQTVAPAPGIWAIGSDLGLEDGPGPAGSCLSIKGVKPIFAQSPQYYYDSPNQSVSNVVRNFGYLTTVKFSGFYITTSSPLPAGTSGQSYSQPLQTTGAAGAVTWSIVSGAMPSGLTLSATTGTVSGTPTQTGTFNFTVQATDSTSQTAQSPFVLNIGAPAAACSITSSTPLPDATAASFYADNLTSSASCIPPLIWSITTGTLPAGVTLESASGVISGTATVVGTNSFTVQLTDAASHTTSTPFALSVIATPNGYNSRMAGRAKGAARAK